MHEYDNATVGSGSVVDEVKFTYDDWGNLASFEQDRDSAVGGGGNQYAVSYTYATSTSGRNTIQRSSMTLPSGAAIDFSYDASGGLLDADASRVTEMIASSTSLARYWYNGAGSVVGTVMDEPDVYQTRFHGTSGVYPDLDRFNRVVTDTWWKDLGTDMAFFDVDISYDQNSNITLTEDQIYTAGFDVSYTMDGLNRLTDADEGTWSGSAITSRTRRQLWTLDQPGNWKINRWDRTGDGDYLDTGEVDDSRSHNDPNELLDRDLDTDGDTAYDDTHFDLTYNKRGDMTDDGEFYKYVYDAFGRLREIRKTSNSDLVVDYKYNPLGFRRSWKYDTDVDGDVDGSDKTFNFAYDERWRIVATYLGSDSTPKEEFVYHNAGSDGYGSSSYIDAVAVRNQDLNSGWTTTTDGTMEKRDYYCQNWRSDVVCMITNSGAMGGRVRYSAYGVPYGIPTSDVDGNGTVSSYDGITVNGWWGTGPHPEGDSNLDGTIGIADFLSANTYQYGVTLGWGKLSQGGSAGGNRKGYMGTDVDPALSTSMVHLRRRFLLVSMGRFLTRDPIGYADGVHLYQVAHSNPVTYRDPSGLCAVANNGACRTNINVSPDNGCPDSHGTGCGGECKKRSSSCGVRADYDTNHPIWTYVTNNNCAGVSIEAIEAALMNDAMRECDNSPYAPFGDVVTDSCDSGCSCSFAGATISIVADQSYKYRRDDIPIVVTLQCHILSFETTIIISVVDYKGRCVK